MKALLLLSVLISLASPALARIGETREQCEARYGKPVKINEEKETVDYKKAGFDVTCYFRDGACVRIVFSHVVADSKVAPMSDPEITTLLKANGGDKSWVKDEKGSTPDNTEWTTETLVAHYEGFGLNMLKISTKAYYESKKSEGAGKARDALKDF